MGYEGYLTSLSDEYTNDFINKKYYEFEKQHPEISTDDIINPKILLPDDSDFARILNPVKQQIQLGDHDLVTIEQTSASLFRCRYSYVEGRGCSIAGMNKNICI